MKTRNVLIPPQGKALRQSCALCLFLLFALVVMPAIGETIRFGFNNTILSGVTKADAESALALWADFVAKEEGVSDTSKVTGYKTVEEMLIDLQGGNLDVAMLTAFEYLTIKDRVQLEVISVGVIQEQIGIPLVIAVHRTSLAQSLKDLQGKELLCESMYVEHIGNYWLDGALSSNGLLPTPRFFSKRRTMDKVSKAVLPVFFNKADACLVRQCALDTMIELNPQLARDLRVIASSPPMLNGLCAIRPGMNATHREILIRRIPTMHQHVKGKQILTLLKLDDATSYKPEMLRAAELIYQESLKLRPGPGEPAAKP